MPINSPKRKEVKEAVNHQAPALHSVPCREYEAKQLLPRFVDWSGIIKFI
jgi:hypothetical protein